MAKEDEVITAQSVLDLITEVQGKKGRTVDDVGADEDEIIRDANPLLDDSPLVPAYRMMTEDTVDAMIKNLGWDEGLTSFMEGFDESNPSQLSGDQGPYVGWWAEGEWSDDCTEDSIRRESMVPLRVEPTFVLTENGVVARGVGMGFQDPDDEDLVYVDPSVFEHAAYEIQGFPEMTRQSDANENEENESDVGDGDTDASATDDAV